VAEKEEVDSVLEEAVSAGATITREAQGVFFGRNGYFADPEGYLWEVAWNPSFPLTSDAGVALLLFWRAGPLLSFFFEGRVGVGLASDSGAAFSPLPP
jgi:hypothetical protein